ncbi:MAG: hypothetical protein FWE08_01575 [Oscillospiraceae bacterium]|nr:hypothetical protein [Oscillospiraceae bacterium]
MAEIIKRTIKGEPFWETFRNWYQQRNTWQTEKTVCVLRGLTGCGKTTFLRHYFRERKAFYFTFSGLEEGLAERLFAERVSAETGVVVSDWAEAIRVISTKYRVILLDDVASISSYKRFQKAFYENMITDISTRPFVALIAQPPDDVTGLADAYDTNWLDYFSIPEVMKLYPQLSKYDTLGLCTVSGGIAWIMREFDMALNFEDNVRKMLEPSSMFIRFMPELLARYFRKSDNYHRILHAIASGNHSVSEIGKFTSFAYNKCDNYLAKLIVCGLVKAGKAESKRGTEKTAYVLTNSYVRAWYNYVFLHQTELRIGSEELIESIVRGIVDKEIHAFHLQRAFVCANERVRESWASLEIGRTIVRAPKVVRAKNFRYTFDAIERSGDKAVFIKVFENPTENCGRVELEKLRKAVAMVNTYYDSRVFIFSKRRFSDYAVAEAARDDVISPVEVDRLRG